MKVKSCPTPSDPMDCSLPGSSIQGTFPARVLEWIPTAFLRNERWFFFFLHLLHWQVDFYHCTTGLSVQEMQDIWVQSLGQEYPLEKEMATHSITLAWKIPWTEEPGRLQSMGSLRVRHHWATSLSLFTFMHWRRKWQPTPVFLPGESHGWQSLVGCRLWGRTESDTTEAT